MWLLSVIYSNLMVWRFLEVYDYKLDSIEMYMKYIDVYSFVLVMYEILIGLKFYEVLSLRDVLLSLFFGWRLVMNIELYCLVYFFIFM